jgi:ATP-dependent Lon protease
MMGLFRKSEEPEQDTKIEELRRLIEQAAMPPEVAKIAYHELETLSGIGQAVAEYTIGVTYIEYLAGLPWHKKTEDNLDLARAERVLNDDHYSLDSVKERVLEHLAVRVLVSNRRPVVLVVDDEDVARKNLAHALAKEAYDVITASNGEEALDAIARTEVDVVITDLRMPQLDGLALLEKLGTRWPDTKIIMVTGYATVPSAVDAMKRGAFSYIAKPFRLDEVREAVRNALESRSRVVVSKGSVLCFSGPPGTGKTSMGVSIAKALGRRFVRLSLGGVKDEAEIRGHRRTYVGARPGRIIEAIRRVESSNPVIMLDEVDKMGHDGKGDPASALLEVLDPEQNHAFVDHYLDVPFDLSQVIFILTANVLDAMPPPLRDRMEVIRFSGYSEEEKIRIASHYLVPRQVREKGLTAHPPSFTDEALHKIIRDYTREAGIRNLERNIATICRKMAKELVSVEARGEPVTVTPQVVERYLGPRKYRFETVDEEERIGVTTGLVLTESGADIIVVEAAKMRGNKELILTGSLGDVMRESAQAALSYIRSKASILGIADDFFERHDIHVHVPLGAIQKDGPSAGITIALALISLLKSHPAKRDVAMTGEITLTGRVLPVGGIRDKLLAARRAGVTTVILPSKNLVDLEDVPETARKGLDVRLVSTIDDAIGIVLA